MIVFGGVSASFNVPPEWTILQNPNSVTAQHDSGALALYYNTTLTLLGEQKFSNVSFMIETFHFVNIDPAVNQTALVANRQISFMNVSVPNAIVNFGVARQLIAGKELLNATIYNTRGCGQAQDALGNYTQFAGPTTTEFSKLGIPVQLYNIGIRLAYNEIESLLAECRSLAGVLPSSGGMGSGSGSGSPGVKLTIWSPQRAITTGSNVTLEGNLASGRIGIAGRPVLFYFNGTYMGSIATDGTGRILGVLSIPFVYKPVGVVSAYAVKNATANFAGATSNSLYFTILFNATKIIIKDPPVYLPTFSFSVRGNLTTVTGIPLPFAPVKVTFLNQSSYVTTDGSGTFTSAFSVPADASNGVYYVYAAFAARGVYGPSFNFTTIEVTHLLLNVTEKVPWLSFAGYFTSVSGSLSANGSVVPNAKISVSSLWGVFQTRSDSAGKFSVTVPIPIWEFAFSRNLSVSASPVQPYIAQGHASTRAGLFNLLFIALPALGVGVTVYEFNNLGLLPKVRRHLTRTKTQQMPTAEIEKEAHISAMKLVAAGVEVSGMIAVYVEAVGLASRKFRIDFRDSQTIREIIREVEKVDESKTGLFSEILLTTEDFLYARKFDSKRVGEAENRLAELRSLWGSGVS